MKAPATYKGKDLVYEEVFMSPFVRPTEESARRILEEIRNCHSLTYGWVELDARIESKDGGFVAVRHHAQYK